MHQYLIERSKSGSIVAEVLQGYVAELSHMGICCVLVISLPKIDAVFIVINCITLQVV